MTIKTDDMELEISDNALVEMSKGDSEMLKKILGLIDSITKINKEMADKISCSY